jgi:hypothetical protein
MTFDLSRAGQFFVSLTGLIELVRASRFAQWQNSIDDDFHASGVDQRDKSRSANPWLRR